MSEPRPHEPRRRERLRPAELIGLAGVVALFVGLVTFLVTRDLQLSLIFLGGTFVFDLIVLAMLMLAVTPNKPAEGERAPETLND